MPQETALYLELSVHHNLALYGELYGMTRSRIAEREKELLHFIALEKWRDEPVSNLSGGMKHRVSLACSMIHEPRLLFLDEPTVGVDPLLRVQFWAHFRSLADAGTTIVVSSHVMDEADRCDELLFVRAGKVIARGSGEELRARAGTDDLEAAFLHFAGDEEAAR